MRKPFSIPAFTLDEFKQKAMGEADILSLHPCIIRGFIQSWPAFRKWADFDSLAQMFGSFPVTAGAPQFTTHKNVKMCQVKTDFASYLDYVQNPDRLEELFKDQWVKGSAETLRSMDMPLYSGNLRIVRHSREAAFEDIDPLLPEPLACWNNDIPYFYQTGNHLWLYVSPAGALTPLHQDNNAVIAYLAQLTGHKEAILYSPDDKRHYYNPAVGYLDPHNPNDAEFPTWREAQPWTASLKEGDLLIWGSNWAHHVVTHEQSITISFDVINDSNLDDYVRAEDWRAEFGHFAMANEDMIRSRIKDPQVHQALDNASKEELGATLMRTILRTALAGTLTEQSRAVKERMLAILDQEESALVPEAAQ